MKRILACLVLFMMLMMLGVVAGCGPAEAPDEVADEEELYSYLQEEDYTSWERAPGYEQRQPAEGPHLSEVIVYIDNTMSSALDTEVSEAPAGAVIAKDAFEDDALNTTVAMQKLDDGSWFFAQWDAEGETMAAGVNEPMCMECHTGENDHILSFELGDGETPGY